MGQRPGSWFSLCVSNLSDRRLEQSTEDGAHMQHQLHRSWPRLPSSCRYDSQPTQDSKFPKSIEDSTGNIDRTACRAVVVMRQQLTLFRKFPPSIKDRTSKSITQHTNPSPRSPQPPKPSRSPKHYKSSQHHHSHSIAINSRDAPIESRPKHRNKAHLLFRTTPGLGIPQTGH